MSHALVRTDEHNSAQQVAGADLAVENPFEVDLAFAAFQVKFGDTAAAARRLSSTVEVLFAHSLIC